MLSQRIYLKGDEGDFVAPSISVKINNDGRYNFNHVKPLNLSTRAFVESKGYRVASINDVAIKNMGKIGDGLFAKNNIPQGFVIAIHGGLLAYYDKESPPGEYSRSCTSENLRNDPSIGTVRKYNHISGDGKCAADKIQHAFDRTPKLEEVLQQRPGLLQNIAFPNIKIENIKTDYDFDVVLLVTDQPVQAGEIFLTDYGSGYVFKPDSNMELVFVFNKKGDTIERLKVDRTNRSLSIYDLSSHFVAYQEELAESKVKQKDCTLSSNCAGFFFNQEINQHSSECTRLIQGNQNTTMDEKKASTASRDSDHHCNN